MPKCQNSHFFSQICDDLTDAIKRAKHFCSGSTRIPIHISNPSFKAISGNPPFRPNGEPSKHRGRPKGSKDSHPRKRRPMSEILASSAVSVAADSLSATADIASSPIAATKAAPDSPAAAELPSSPSPFTDPELLRTEDRRPASWWTATVTGPAVAAAAAPVLPHSTLSHGAVLASVLAGLRAPPLLLQKQLGGCPRRAWAVTRQGPRARRRGGG